MENKVQQINNHHQVIQTYLTNCSGLEVLSTTTGEISLKQEVDGKVLNVNLLMVEKVIERVDSDGNPFIQVNFDSGKKLLFTDTLVGFKPADRYGLDMTKLPKVVTTPDLIGVIEALEDSLSANVCPEDIESLRRLFHSVIDGAEDIGFNLQFEKSWLKQLNRSGSKATA